MHRLRVLRASIVIGGLMLAAGHPEAISRASAETLTYDIVDYPAAEIDLTNGFQDVVSGTITASTAGTLGSYTAGSFIPATDPTQVTLSFDITLQNLDPGAGNPSYTFSGSDLLSSYLGSGTITFSDTNILLNGYLGLSQSLTGSVYEMYWRPDLDTYTGYAYFNPPGAYALQFSQSPATTLDPSPWTIGVAAPEPAAMSLGLAALLAMGAVGWRSGRRRGGVGAVA